MSKSEAEVKSAHLKPKPKLKKKKVHSKRKIQGTCFVLMPFKEPFDTYYSVVIEPAIEAAHLTPLRGDSLFRPSPIMADVWQMIQDAKVLVAELTEKNANVFYELGLSHAIGKPAILISGTIDDVPFDLQPLRVILYNKSDPDWGEELKSRLVASLEETLGDLGRAVPPMFRKIVKSQAPEESALEVRLFELERRVASLTSPRQDNFTERGERSDRGISWDRVESYSRQGDLMRSQHPAFECREAAVAWAMTHLIRYPVSIVRTRLSRMLSHNEVGIVLDLAMMRGPRKFGVHKNMRRTGPSSPK